jgi:integrase
MFDFGEVPPHLNPARGIAKYEEEASDRYLNDAELGRLGDVLDQHEREGRLMPAISYAIRLLGLTGCRVNEVCTLTWPMVDLEEGVLRLADSKNRLKKHALGDAAVALLTSIKPMPAMGFVFYGRDPAKPLNLYTVENAWKRLRRAAGIEDAGLHALRHTVGTAAGQLAQNAFQIRDLLRHKHVSTTNRYVSRDTQRELADRVAARIANALAGSTCEVVSLAKRRRRRAE